MPDLSQPEDVKPKLPPIADKANDLEAIRAALVDAAGVSFGLWVSYLFVLFYLLVGTFFMELLQPIDITRKWLG